MLFEWDKTKCEINLQKHGIDFANVTELFTHPHLIKEDIRHNYGEKRWITIGKMREIIVVMVFTLRENNIRIISARKANKKEEGVYYEKSR